MNNRFRLVILLVVTLVIVMTFAVPKHIKEDPVRLGTGPDGDLSPVRWIGFDRGGDPREPDVEVIETGADHLRLRVKIHGLTSGIVTGGGELFEQIAMPGAGVTTVIGKAEMPIIRKWIEVPHGARITVRVEDAEVSEYPMGELGLTQPIYPAQPPIPKSSTQPAVFTKDSSHYKESVYYPTEMASITDVAMLRGRRLARLEITPVAYSPKLAMIRWAGTIDVLLEWSGADLSLTSREITKHRSESFDRICSGRILNFRAYDPPPAREGGSRVSMESRARSAREGMLIITADRYESELEDLVEWKRRKGYRVEVVGIDLIGSSKDSIKAYLQNVYDTWSDPPLSYVILVGDIEEVPTYIVSTTHVADPWYSRLSGPDYLPDVWIGRLSVSSEAEAAEVVGRIVDYERTEFTSSGWLKKATFIATDDPSHYEVAEGTHNYCIASFMDPQSYVSDKLYAISEYAHTADVIAAINEGRAVVTYSGHGSKYAWLGPEFDQADISSLLQGQMTPFVISHACQTGSIEEPECFGETWLRKGALAFWGASNNSFWGEDDVLQKEIYRAIYEEGYYNLGQMTADGLLGLYDHYGGSGRTEYYYEVYHLLGDPSMMLWTDEPSVMSVGHAPVMAIGAPSFQVSVSDVGGAVEGAVVSLYDPDQGFQAVALTDTAGVALVAISPPPAEVGELELTVTGQGHLPYEGIVGVIAPDGPYMVVTDFSIDDSSGDGDGAVNPGEAVVMSVTALNVGPEDGGVVVAALSTASTVVEIVDGTVAFGDIPAGESRASLYPQLRWEADPAAEDGTVIDFLLVWSESGGAWGTMDITVMICANEDGDGWATCQGDCEDTDPDINPGVAELCDGVDNNCDGIKDEGFPDTDLDGASDCIDCAFEDPYVYPGAAELCDGLDNDCDGLVPADEVNMDGDAYRICFGDCDDTNPEVYPGHPEVPGNKIDDDCDGLVDEDDCFIGAASL